MTALEASADQRRFSPVVVLALVLVGVFSLAGLTVLSAYAPELRSGDNGGAHALSRSAVGFAGAVRLLNAVGQPAAVSRTPPAEETDSLLVLTPAPHHTAASLDAVAHTGTRLVVLPKRLALPHPVRPGWVREGPALPNDAVLNALPRAKGEALALHRRATAGHAVLTRPDGTAFGRTGEIQSLQTLSAPGWIPVLVDESDRAVLLMHDKTGLYVLTDPDLMNTHGLKSPDTARVAAAIPRLIWKGDGAVLFDVTLHGFSKPRSVLRMMLEPPLLGATLCLALATALVAWQGFVRFGASRTPGRAVALGKRALADNTAGLVRLARREHRMAEPYARLVRASAARAVAAPRELDGEALDAFLDRLGTVNGAQERFTALAEQARAARSASDLLKVARGLHRWRLEMTRGRQ